ncbi:MAG: hypothetical protein RLZZ455_74 [Candidatus Parcubacteria bacterium]|jgi:ABC-type nitrate/sulfonate/bicarbonate transport system substrate-binding protein
MEPDPGNAGERNMKKKIILGAVVLLCILGVNLYPKEKQITSTPVELQEVTVALDWTPNTNHTGIYVAQKKGWYKDEGVRVTILPYSQAVSSDVLVATKKADVGISSTEGVVSDAALGSPVVSIASIIQHNTSSLVVREDSGITRPSDLDGKIYGGFGAPFEEAVVRKIIQSAGGQGEFETVTLTVSAMQALESGQVDFVWIFDGWDGVAAKMQGLSLTAFPITAFGIPDYSTPNIIAHPDSVNTRSDRIKRFMKATAKGYEYAREYPIESANLLLKAVPKGTFADADLVRQSQLYLSRRYADTGGAWGIQKKNSWTKYPAFMLKEKLLTDAKGKVVTSLNYESLYSNVFLFEK